MVVVPIGLVLVLVVMLARSWFDPLAFVLVLTRLLLYLMASALGALVCPSYLSAMVPVVFALVLRCRQEILWICKLMKLRIFDIEMNQNQS